MAIQITTTTEGTVRQAGQTAQERVLTTFQAMLAWPHWHEIYLNCVKESPLSYEAFAAAVRAGDDSQEAFDKALVASRMSREEFDRYLPEFLKFMALYTEYAPIGMLSDGVDQIWHAFQLVSDRYREFCYTFIGKPVDHLPCSLYGLYGIEDVASCEMKCVPKTCEGNGGGCGSSKVNRDHEEKETMKSNILSGSGIFIEAYTKTFGAAPDRTIWNQICNV